MPIVAVMLNPRSRFSRLLRRGLLRVRPAPLASWLKRCLGIRRGVFDTAQGRFYLDPVSDLGAALLESGEYESAMTRTLVRCLQPGDVFVDVGANEGYFSALGGQRVGAQGRVIAVEPQPRLRPVLEENCRLNALTNVTLVPCAVSDQRSSVDLYLSPDTNTGASGLARSTRYRVPTVRVNAITLADLFDQAHIERANLLKMDIEGFEYEAVLGSPDVFRQRRIVAFALELHPQAIAARGLDPRRIEAALQDWGYRIDASFDTLVFRP
jgi:FkbM family methyltransferase